MTLLLAQQCRLLRAPRGAASALQRMARPIHAMPARSYSSQNDTAAQGERTHRVAPIRKIIWEQPAIRRINYLPKRSKGRSKEDVARNKILQARSKELSHFVTPLVAESTPAPVEGATLIPASIAAAKPEHFIEKIAPLQSSNPITSQSHVVFLLTPSFAHWLLDDQKFLKEALDKLYHNCARESPPHANTATPPKIHATCAVVDRLPEAQPLDNTSLQEHVQGRASQPPVTETGHEGISYVVLPAKAEWNLNLQEKPVASCIDFLTHTKTDAQGRQYDRIRVPLANTVFQTGEPYTMIHSKWQYDSSHKLSMTQRDTRKRTSFNLSALPVPPSKNTPLSYVARELSIPLIPLTVPRQVDSHMGNIIRSIVGPNGGATITAATELEQVVPQYFKSRNEPAQATSAWALVIPKSLAQQCTSATMEWLGRNPAQQTDLETSPDSSLPKDFERLWQSPQPIWSNNIQDAVNKGARLHKVLSGGGGWGKKAGLLSLDPMPIGPPAEKGSQQADVEDDYHSVDDFSIALKPVIQDGDFIQFFTSPAQAQESDEMTKFARLRQVEEAAGKGVWTYEFGVIPSTVDAMPGGSWQHKGEASTEIAVFKGSFGALVEGGLTLMTALNVDYKSGYAEANLNTTTIDVPFSRWSAVQLRPTMNPSLTVGEARKISKAQSTFIHDSSISVNSIQCKAISTCSLLESKQRPTHKSTQTLIRSTQAARSKSTNFSRLRDAYAGCKSDERSEEGRHKKHQGGAQHASPYSYPAKAQLGSTTTPPTRLAIRKVQSGGREPLVLRSKAKDSTTQFHPNGRAEDTQPFLTLPRKLATHQKSREKKPHAQSHSVPIRKVLTIPTEPAAHDTPAPKIPSAPSPPPTPLIRKVSSHSNSSLSLAYLTSQRSKNRLRRRHQCRGKTSQSHTVVPIKRTLSRPRPLSAETAAVVARARLSEKILARLTTQLCIVARLDLRRVPAIRRWRAGGEADRGAGRKVRRTLARKRKSGGSVLSQKEKRRADGMERRGARSWQQRDAGREMPVRRVRGRMRIRRFVVRERKLDEEIGSWLGGGGGGGPSGRLF